MDKHAPKDSPKLSETRTLQAINSCGPKWLDDKLIKKYRKMGHTCQEIADILKCAKSSIVRRLHGIAFTTEELEEAKKLLPDLKLSDYLKYRSYITPAKLKKASAVELAKMTSFKFNEYLLATGQTTVNVGLTANDMKEIKSMEKEAEEDGKRKAVLLKMLEGKQIIVDNSEV